MRDEITIKLNKRRLLITLLRHESELQDGEKLILYKLLNEPDLINTQANDKLLSKQVEKIDSIAIEDTKDIEEDKEDKEDPMV